MVLELIAHCSINLMIHLTFLQVTQLLPKWQDGGGVATMTFFRTAPITLSQSASGRLPPSCKKFRRGGLSHSRQQGRLRVVVQTQSLKCGNQNINIAVVIVRSTFFALLSNLFAKSASDDRSFPNSIMVKLEILLPNVFNLALHKVF